MSAQDKNMISQIQRFTVSSISMLNLLHQISEKHNDVDEKDKISMDRFIASSQKYIESIKTDNNFEYPPFIKKAFGALRSETQCKYLQDKNPELFNIRDGANKIVTVIPGIDIGFAYRHLSDDAKEQFWQYMYLFSSSVFNIIKMSNAAKFCKYSHISDTLIVIENYMAKTGIMFNNQIFNPFIGVGDSNDNYSVSEMFTGGELPKQQNLSIESALSMLGIDKLFNGDNIRNELKNFDDTQITMATEKISEMMGVGADPESKEVYGMLIKDIVSNLKENGIDNIDKVLRNVAENAKNIDRNKMIKTTNNLKDFMENSQDKIKNLKDANGNPIGEQMMNKMNMPMNIMKMMNVMKNNR